MIDRFEQLTYFIYGIYRDIQKIEKDEMEKLGLRGSYAQYLLALSRFPEGLTSARLCEICDKDKAATSRIVSELISLGFVRRGDGSTRSYNARLTLTDKGLEAAAFVLKKIKSAVRFAGEGLSDDDRKLMYSALSLIHTNLKNICKNGIPEEE